MIISLSAHDGILNIIVRRYTGVTGIEMKWNHFLWGIICILSLLLPLIIFSGSIDDFAPKHAIPVMEILRSGNINISNNDNAFFYIYGSVISIITGISPFNLVFFPIQILPTYVVYYALSYYLSRSHLIANLFSLIFLTTGTTGTPSIFFWPHGIGYILFLTIILILLVLYKKEISFEKSIIMLTLSIISLIMISYDYAAILFLMLVFSVVCITGVYWLKRDVLSCLKNLNLYTLTSPLLFLISLLLVFELGIQSFVYRRFLPILEFDQNSFIDPFEKILTVYQGVHGLNPLSELYVTYPKILTQIGLIKYGIIYFTLIVLGICVYKYFKSSSIISLIYLGATVLESAVYAVIRVVIGGIGLTMFYESGIVATNILSQYSQKKFVKYWIVLVIIVLLVTNALLLGIRLNLHAVNRETNNYEYLTEFSVWYQKNVDSSDAVYSDEFSRDIINAKNYQSNLSQKIPYIDIINLNIVLEILKRAPWTSHDTYIIINYKINSFSIQSWNILKPWYLSQKIIDGNKGLDKIYDTREIGFYCY
jgi:hypothetical protein